MISERILTWAKYLDEKFDVSSFDIYVPCCRTDEEKKFVQEELIKRGALPLEKLEIGKTYIGCCRNAGEAIWQGDRFCYQRNKFGLTFPETINHFQNDDGFDVFVPIKLKK